MPENFEKYNLEPVSEEERRRRDYDLAKKKNMPGKFKNQNDNYDLSTAEDIKLSTVEDIEKEIKKDKQRYQQKIVRQMEYYLNKRKIYMAYKLSQDFSLPEKIIQQSAKEAMLDCLSHGENDRAIDIKNIFSLPKSVILSLEVQQSAEEIMQIQVDALLDRDSSRPLSEALQIKDNFSLSKETIQRVAKRGIIKCLSCGEIKKALQIKDAFLLSKNILASPEIQQSAKVEIIHLLAYRNVNEALQFIKDAFFLPENFMSNPEVQQVAREEMIKCLSCGEIKKALQIKDAFSLSENFMSNPEVQQAARKGMIECLSYAKIDDAIKIKDTFSLPLLAQTELMEIKKIDPNIKDSAHILFEKEIVGLCRKYKLKISEYLYLVKMGKIKDEQKTDDIFFSQLYDDLKVSDKRWQDVRNISGPFEVGAKEFGYKKMFDYIYREGLSRHDALHNFNKIIEVANISSLKPEEFYANILCQVNKDDSQYEQGTAHHYLNSLADNINLDFEAVIKQTKEYQDLPKLQQLLTDMNKPEKVFASWKNLKKYEEICSLVQKKELLDKLKELKKQGKIKLYNYIETLAFHPNISMDKVFEFWQNTKQFLDTEDSHTPEEVHSRKKPSNYIEIPNLDLSGEELRDALVEGTYDKLQAFKPLEITYKISREQSEYENKKINELIVIALGKRSENIKGKAKDPQKIFSDLVKLFKEKKADFNAFLKSDNPIEEFPQVATFENEIKSLIFDEKIGLQEQNFDEYRAKINLKSDPDGVVAGNDTACCMPFGSGKNNVYTFNPICSLLTIQKKTADKKWRTVAQSVLTKDKDINKNISDIINEFQKTQGKMHEIVSEEVLIDKQSIITCDNIEVSPNYKNYSNASRILENIYADFFKEYLKRYSAEENLDSSKIIIGMGFSDLMTHLPTENNTFVPLAPVAYTDNAGSQCYVLRIGGSESKKPIEIKKKINEIKLEKSQNLEPEAKLPRSIRYLTFYDTLPVAYIEGKAYSENESLIEYLHNMENALIAKDVNNEAKNRPNISLKYVDSSGKTKGYILAYEGRKNETDHGYDEEDEEIEAHSTEQEEPVIYISDLATDKTSKLAGGELILAFTQLYKENYLDKNKFVPLYAQMREQTSYAIIKKQIEKLSAKIGVEFNFEEIGTYKVGNDTMHEVMIRPKAK